MKLIDTKDAVGHVLCHDITQIIRGVVKDTVFRKGHVVAEEDIPVLLSVGTEHLYVWEKDDTMLHENEAAEILYGLCGNEHISRSEVKEGKIECIAEIDGLFKVDVERLDAVNSLDGIMIATRHTNFPVKKGDKLAGARVIPLVIEKERMEEARRAGYRTAVCFVIQMENVSWFEPNDRTHPAFGAALRHAAEAGVEVLAMECRVTPEELLPGRPVPVRL